jgi:hypothetical protein
MKMILSSARMPKRRKRRMRKVGTKRTKASIRRKKTNLTLMLMKISKRKGSIGEDRRRGREGEQPVEEPRKKPKRGNGQPLKGGREQQQQKKKRR